jgi:predicted transcriptional regulator
MLEEQKKAVLISIKTKWVDLILEGKKGTEIRKTAPKITKPFDMYIYECGTGRVVAVCECWIILEYYMDKEGVDLLSRSSCVPKKQIREYAGRRTSLYGWSLQKARWLKEQKRLEEFGLKRPPQSWQYIDPSFGKRSTTEENMQKIETEGWEAVKARILRTITGAAKQK